jgi:type I restriction enzyme S subunit
METERQLSRVDESDAMLRANIGRASRLRQALLQRAFSGRLVPQDPNDEPTSALLARLAAPREGTPVQASLL